MLVSSKIRYLRIAITFSIHGIRITVSISGNGPFARFGGRAERVRPRVLGGRDGWQRRDAEYALPPAPPMRAVVPHGQALTSLTVHDKITQSCATFP
jgi:hypothetical protein